MEIIVKYFDPKMPKLEKITKGDWIDLYCVEDVVMHQGVYRLIPLGVAMKLPEGYEAIVAPRSSTFKKYGILQANSIGVIDNSYSGPDDQWMFPAYATMQTRINKYERICQFRILESQPEIEFREVVDLDDANRGGFGSTGK